VRQRTDRASAKFDYGNLTITSKTKTMKTNWALALVVAGTLASGFAMAEKGGKGKDERADKGNSNQGARHDERAEKGNSNQGARHDGGKREHFGDRHRVVVTEYYGQQFRSGRCPPGLAKKHNGCMPPGQAKKWHTGQYLPRDVVYYSVPQSLVIEFGPPPSGHRYVRVGADILLIAIGTRMIVDALSG